MSKPKKLPAQQQKQDSHGKTSEMTPQPEIIREGYKGSDKLKGRVALITGGDSGIGRSVAVYFAREGADVAILYFTNDEDANITRELVEKEGAKFLAIKGDVGDESFCQKAVKQVKKELGRITILVNNAAEQHDAESLEELTEEQITRTFRTNIFGYIFMAKAVLPDLKKGDCIINTTSITSYRGHEKLMDYASTKGAITAFTRSLSQNIADKGIRVNGVAPGPIWTPLIPSSFDKKTVAKFGQDTPMGRPGQPSEVAPAYVFLASEDASYITGQVIHVNGGSQIGS